MGISETRWRAEFLRVISYLTDYIQKMNIISFVMMAGILMVVIAPLLLLSELISYEVTLAVFYIGFTVTFYGYYYLARARRRFYRHLRRIFEQTIVKSADYEKFARHLRSKTAKMMNEIAKKEHILALRERDLQEKQMHISKLENQLDKERQKLSKKKKLIRRTRIT